jgi:hypothetical protein
MKIKQLFYLLLCLFILVNCGIKKPVQENKVAVMTPASTFINIEQIDVESTSNNRDNNLVNVSVTFGLLNQVDLNTVSFTIAA